jgi:Family of unknown function (DUF5372)
LVVRKTNWAEDRVFYLGAEDQLVSVPAGWTDVDPPDPFEVVAAGRCPFRLVDLMALVELVESIRPAKRRRRVKPTLPLV